MTKTRKLIPYFLFSLLLIPAVYAQNYSIGWHKIAGGGGASSGTNGSGIYSVNGTIGQQDAGKAVSGGNYSVSGGFWSIIALVQTPGAPALEITRSGTSIIVSWPYPSTGFSLQQSSNLGAMNWVASSFTVITNGSSNSVTITPSTGNLFLRLSNQ